MALTDEGGSTGMVMPVSPMYGNGNGGFGGFGGDGWWILLLFILLGGNNGWGNNGFGGGGYGGGMGGLYPWMNQAEQINSGFRDQMINSTITSIPTQLCDGFAGVNAAIANGFAGAESSANARQMANMQTAFGLQTAMSQGFNALGSQFADCCCENRLASCQTQNIIQNEGNVTRFADANNTRDIIQSQSNGTQAILDKLCQLELDGKNDRIADLERQLTMANLAASQTAQTAALRAGQVAEVDALYDRLSACPVPTMPVYGMQPIFTCGGNTGCGCGNSGF